MSRWRRWRPRDSTLWRTSAAFWLLNAVFNGVTASVSSTPSVYLALGGINVFLAGLSYFVSQQYRRGESSQGEPGGRRQLPLPNSRVSDLNVK